jgi:D-amino-acid dehydrogenase
MEVLIVGGGVIGLSSAYYAAQKGHTVRVLDRNGHEEGCSFGNAGMVVPSHFVPLAAPGMVWLGLRFMWNKESPFYVKPRLDRDLFRWGLGFIRASRARAVARAAPLLRDLHLVSRRCYEEWASSLGDFGLEKKGLLMLCKTGRALEEEAEVAAMGEKLGVPAEVLGPRQVASIEPGLRMEVAGAVYFPKDCHLDPVRLMRALRRRVAEVGVTVVSDAAVTGWRSGSAGIEAVSTDLGEFRADRFVVAAGVWSAGLLRQLGVNLPIEAGKGYSLTLREPKHLPEHCAILTEARVAMTPMGTALRFGGTMELAGLDESVNPRRVQGIISSVGAYLPDLGPENFAGVTPWCGLRPCSPDGLPYLGGFKRYGNLFAATGHGMLGVSLAPVTGKLLAELLSGEKPSLDLSALAPDRYSWG